MIDSIRRKTLFLLGLITLIIMMIAASLPSLELQPGMPLPSLQHGQVVAPQTEDEVVSVPVNDFVIILIALILAGAILYGAYRLLTGTDWKFVLRLFRSILIICVILSGLAFLIILVSKSTDYASSVEMPVATPKPVVTSPLGSTPTPLLWLVGIGLLALIVLVGVWIYTLYCRPKPIDLVGIEAEKAWQALKDGLDLKGVIIKCYLQMSLALKKTRGIERKDFMTTGEFESLLEAAGIPHEPIHQLTWLFDAVRYGKWEPNPIEEQRAIQCLEAIMLHCRETRGTS